MTLSPDESTGGAPPATSSAAATLPPPSTATAASLLERADALAAGPRPAEALPLYRELLAVEPGHVDARVRLAQLLIQHDELEPALTLLAEALRNAPDQTECLVLRGEILTRLRRYE
jgi:tetratricopeptide (TPR) repeat protein